MFRFRRISPLPFLLLALATAAPATADPGDPVRTWVPNGPVRAVALSGSTAYVGGEFDKVAPYTGASTAVDPSTAEPPGEWPEVAGIVTAAVSDGAGGWYIGGSFNEVGGVARENLAHVLADGSLDQAWRPAANDQVNALLVRGGSVVVGGSFTTVNGAQRRGLAEVDATSGEVSSMSLDLEGPRVKVSALVSQQVFGVPTLYVAGRFDKAGGAARSNLAAFSLATRTVTAFDPNVDGEVYALALSQGLIFAGGEFRHVNGNVERDSLAQFVPVDGGVTPWNARLSSSGRVEVHDLDVDGTSVYAVGSFGKVRANLPQDVLRSNAAALDLTTANPTAWNPRPGDVALQVEVVGQTAYLGGGFETLGQGTVKRNNAAAVDKASGSALAWNPDPHGYVAAIGADSDEVVIGGSFHTAGGVGRRNLAAIDLRSGEPTAFDPRVGGPVHALALDGDGAVWAGGTFVSVNDNVPRSALAELDPVTGQAGPFSQPIDGAVRALAVDGSTVYAGGDFTKVDTAVRRHAAAFRDVPGTTGALLTFDPGADKRVSALALAHGRVYLGGEFTKLGGGATERRHLAAVEPATGSVTGFDPSPDKPVRALLPSDGSVIAGGEFATAGGAQRRGVAMLDAESGAAGSWDAGLDGSVHALASDGLQIFAGGRFGSAGGSPRGNVAALDRGTGAAAAWSPRLVETFHVPVQALGASPGGSLVAGGTFVAQGSTVPTAQVAAFRLPPVPGSGDGGPGTPGGPGGEGQPGGGADTPATADTQAPAVSRFAATPRRFRVAARATPRVARRARRGTRLRFGLSEPATVKITIERARKAKCRTRGLKAKRCVRFTRATTMTRRALPQGTNTIAFSGRVGRRALAAGSYRATIVATDAASNRSRPRSAKFTVVRR